MKTKIVYISGNEIFDMNDIRAAFEEVRVALNLDKSTVLFGVPVDADDACLIKDTKPSQIETTVETPEIPQDTHETIQTHKDTANIPKTPQIIDTEPTITESITETEIKETVVEQPKRRGRPRKEVVEEIIPEPTHESEEKVVPILSVLSTKAEEDTDAQDETAEPEIVPDITTEETIEETIIDEIPESEDDATAVVENVDLDDDDAADLEKLLSAMTPLAEDIMEDKKTIEIPDEPDTEPIETPDEDMSVDATLEQLATEFAESQDKIATENKSSRSKIGKLRNILPFKQSKHKDQGLGDLFGWAGVAANDEDFSVPGFFTNAASRK